MRTDRATAPPPALMLLSLEGALLREDGLLFRSLRRVANEAGLFPSDPWLRARARQLPACLFTQMLDNVGRRNPSPGGLVKELDRVLGDAVDQHPPRLRRSAPSALQGLRARRVRVALISSLSAPIALRIQSRLGLSDLTLVPAEDAGRGLPGPDPIRSAMKRCGIRDPGQVAVCGDAPSELIGGAAAGCRWVVGVAQGTHGLEELASHPHTHLLRDLGDVLDLLHAPC